MKTQDVDGMDLLDVQSAINTTLGRIVWSQLGLKNLASIWKDHLEPKGWRWERFRGFWCSLYPDDPAETISVKDTGDFLTDFSRLTLKALLAQKETEAQ